MKNTYNLTAHQQAVVRWIVQKVRGEILTEEFSFVFMGRGKIHFVGVDTTMLTDCPPITEGVLDALKTAGLLIFTKNVNNTVLSNEF